MKGILVVRKYKNRRLYDTERSIHLTRDELLGRIREGRDVQVQEVGSGEDVTVETLLQLIQSEDGLAAQLLTPEFLHFLIRTDATLVGRFFRETMPLALQSFQQTLSGMGTMPGAGGGMMGAFANPFMNPWAGFGMPGFAARPPAAAPEPAPAEGEDELDEMRQQLEKMQAELSKLKRGKKR